VPSACSCWFGARRGERRYNSAQVLHAFAQRASARRVGEPKKINLSLFSVSSCSIIREFDARFFGTTKVQ
jgi:hypothetical protein